MQRRSLLRIALAACVWAIAMQGAQAQSYFFGNESLGYTGSYTQYSGANGSGSVLSSGTVFQTDMNAYLSTNSNLAGAPPGSNGTQFQTITYVTNAGTNGPTSGNYLGNLMQVFGADATSQNQVKYDPNTNTWSVTSEGYSTGGNSAFVPANGTNTAPINGILAQNAGDWASFAFSADVTSSSPGVEGAPGIWTIDQVNTTSATGTFKGIFNNSFDGTSYLVDLTINNINAARSFPGNNTSGGAAAAGFFGPLDGFEGVIPEPASCLTFGLVFGASAAYGWRRRSRKTSI